MKTYGNLIVVKSGTWIDAKRFVWGGETPKTNVDGLRASIYVWLEKIQILYQSTELIASQSDSCPLCQMYVANQDVRSCGQCPVFLHTGHRQCGGTPWTKYRDAASVDQQIRAALSEVRFLGMLLKKEEKENG